MTKKKSRKQARQRSRAASAAKVSRLEALVSLPLSNFEDARSLILNTEIYSFIEHKENSGVTDMKDSNGIYDATKVVSQYLSAEGQNIAGFLTNYKTSLTEGTAAEKSQAVADMKTNVENMLTHLVSVYVNELNENTLKQRAADHTLLADAAQDTAKYKLTTKNGKERLRRKLKTPEYQALFDAMLPLLGRPVPKPRTPRAAGTPLAAPKVPAAYSRMIALSNDPNAYLKVETQQGIDELRDQFKGKYLVLFDEITLPLLKSRAADHRYEEAKNAFTDDYSTRAQALAGLERAEALGSKEAEFVKESYVRAIDILETADGTEGKIDTALELLRGIRDKVNVATELSCIGKLKFAQWHNYLAINESNPAKQKKLYADAVGFLKDVLGVIPNHKEAQLRLTEYEAKAK